MACPLRTYPTLLFAVVSLLSCTGGNGLVVKTCVVGDDVVLPGEAGNNTDATDLPVHWSRTDPPHDVHFRRDGKDVMTYEGRTSLFNDELKNGNVSLKLSRVKKSDEGTYKCYLTELNQEVFVRLIVGNGLVVKTCVVGDDVVLPCDAGNNTDATDRSLLWSRTDPPHDVHFRRDGKDVMTYEGRTSLFNDELKNGNVSLKLSRVKKSDEGTYKCYLTELNQEVFVRLIVETPQVPDNRSLDGHGDTRSDTISLEVSPAPPLTWPDGVIIKVTILVVVLITIMIVIMRQRLLGLCPKSSANHSP